MRRPQHSSGEHSASTGHERPGLVAAGCAGAVRVYQLVFRPLLPPACRFAPSCSEYAREAFLTYGVAKGGGLALRRLARCNGWQSGGYDPVPAPKR